jgi:hypothetical protein
MTLWTYWQSHCNKVIRRRLMYRVIESASEGLTIGWRRCDYQQCTSCSHYNRGASRTELIEKGPAAALDRASEIIHLQSNSRCQSQKTNGVGGKLELLQGKGTKVTRRCVSFLLFDKTSSSSLLFVHLARRVHVDE